MSVNVYYMEEEADISLGKYYLERTERAIKCTFTPFKNSEFLKRFDDFLERPAYKELDR